MPSSQFDPLNLSDYVPLDWARRAELSNGRSAMLATVGWFFPKVFGTFDSQDVTTTDPIDAILQADPQWWAQFILLCGVFETWKYKAELDGKSFLGGAEPAVDYLKLWPTDPAKQEEMRIKELKNARLAMIGIAGLVSNHVRPIGGQVLLYRRVMNSCITLNHSSFLERALSPRDSKSNHSKVLVT